MSVSVVGYVRASTGEQSASGAGLDAQKEAIRAEAVRRGWDLGTIYEDRAASGKSLAGRPGLQEALAAVESRSAAALVAARVDRVSRSVGDFAGLLERSRRRGWSLVALDIGLDTTTPSGEMMANVVSSFAQYERRLIGQRTRDALAARRMRGVNLGRPAKVSPGTIARIRRLRGSGHSLARIAAELNSSGTPTAQGGALWHASTIHKILLRVEERKPRTTGAA